MVGIPRPLCPSKGGEEQGEDMFSRMKRVHPNRVDLDKTNGEKEPARQLEQPRQGWGLCMLTPQKPLPSSCASVDAWVIISSVKGLPRALWVWRPLSSMLMSARSQDILAFLFFALMPPIPYRQSTNNHRVC